MALLAVGRVRELQFPGAEVILGLFAALLANKGNLR
jgi:hypothetical protein